MKILHVGSDDVHRQVVRKILELSARECVCGHIYGEHRFMIPPRRVAHVKGSSKIRWSCRLIFMVSPVSN
jgi:hypothetical protein